MQSQNKSDHHYTAGFPDTLMSLPVSQNSPQGSLKIHLLNILSLVHTTIFFNSTQRVEQNKTDTSAGPAILTIQN